MRLYLFDSSIKRNLSTPPPPFQFFWFSYRAFQDFLNADKGRIKIIWKKPRYVMEAS